MSEYVGIVDDYGIESFIPVEDGKYPTALGMRASMNRHRNAVVYAVDLEENEVNEINTMLEDEDHMDAFIYLFGTGKVKVEEGYEDVGHTILFKHLLENNG